jgi:hypothetical protein
MKMVPKARFEPATTFFIEKKKLSGDLEDFKLFAVATLNLSKETVKRYARTFKIFQRVQCTYTLTPTLEKWRIA